MASEADASDTSLAVMAGLVPAIHAGPPASNDGAPAGVDARHKAGHDGAVDAAGNRIEPARPHRLPPSAPEMRIGLLGGSFNPAHEGHRLASLTALRRFRLDRVWWLVTPGNPLKDNAGLPTLDARCAAAARVARHPGIVVTGLEARLGTRYTADTVAALRARLPQVRFVWLMGADNMREFHRWRRWRSIAAAVPIGVVDRPGSTLRVVTSRAGVALGHARRPETEAVVLADAAPPAWLLLHGPRSALSSTGLRRGHTGEKTRPGATRPETTR